MILAIDASNIRSGGGLTHLKQLIIEGEPKQAEIEQVIVWSSQATLDQLPNRPWLLKKTHNLLNKTFIHTFLFQLLFITNFLKKDEVDLLFVPGGTFLGLFKPFVTMSQNMLPFEIDELKRFPSFISRLKFYLLNFTQSHTFKNALGVIFLTEYAQNYIKSSVDIKNSTIVSHGINLNFINEPKVQKDIKSYSYKRPFKLLYVSTVTVYKHQWNIAEAVLKLRLEGYPIQLDLVGGHTKESIEKLNLILEKDSNKVINYKGLIKYEELEDIYKNADAFIFGSSCENQPIILLEAMSAGLPILCSNIGPMPEVLGENQFYFNPLDVDSIYNSLKKFIENPLKREQLVKISYDKSLKYTWKDCAALTFNTLNQFYKNENNKK